MAMKKTAVLINTARGAVVKEGELIEALKRARLRVPAWMCLRMKAGLILVFLGLIMWY